jgi:hypothetical protein
VLAQMAAWGRKYLPVAEELSIRAQPLEQGDPALWADFMQELRERHLGRTPQPKQPSGSVGERLQKAYEGVVASRR